MALNGGLKYFRLFVSILTYQKTVLSIEIFLCICNKNGMKLELGHDGFPRAGFGLHNEPCGGPCSHRI